jgi:alkyl sulfatase BDS1-like metallo-beta-lactamase superfamily hydrolase
MNKLIVAAALALAVAAPAAAAGQDFNDRQDFAFAERASSAPARPEGSSPPTARRLGPRAYDFLKGPAPASVNASLWRQSGLLARHGLFEVTKGVWQVAASTPPTPPSSPARPAGSSSTR